MSDFCLVHAPILKVGTEFTYKEGQRATIKREEIRGDGSIGYEIEFEEGLFYYPKWLLIQKIQTGRITLIS